MNNETDEESRDPQEILNDWIECWLWHGYDESRAIALAFEQFLW